LAEEGIDERESISQKVHQAGRVLQAQAANNPTGDWLATTAQGTTVVMRPFMSIDDESYSTYVRAS
jgi:hypothetical protein